MHFFCQLLGHRTLPSRHHHKHSTTAPRRWACPRPVQGVLDFKGGEAAALARLNYYLFESNLIATYFDSRNGMLGAPPPLARSCALLPGLHRGGRPTRSCLRAGPVQTICPTCLTATQTHPCCRRRQLFDQVCALAGARLPLSAHHLPRDQAVRSVRSETAAHAVRAALLAPRRCALVLSPVVAAARSAAQPCVLGQIGATMRLWLCMPCIPSCHVTHPSCRAMPPTPLACQVRVPDRHRQQVHLLGGV